VPAVAVSRSPERAICDTEGWVAQSVTVPNGIPMATRRVVNFMPFMAVPVSFSFVLAVVPPLGDVMGPSPRRRLWRLEACERLQ